MADTKKEISGSDTVPEIHRNVDPNDLPPNPKTSGGDSSDGDSDDRMTVDTPAGAQPKSVKGPRASKRSR